jgi:hypothetical protein
VPEPSARPLAFRTMPTPRFARTWFAVTSAVAAAALLVQLVLVLLGADRRLAIARGAVPERA